MWINVVKIIWILIAGLVATEVIYTVYYYSSHKWKFIHQFHGSLALTYEKTNKTFYGKKDFGDTRLIDLIQLQEDRKKILFKFCNRSKDENNINYMLYSDRVRLLYCFIPKAACTTWKRLFQVFDEKLTFEKAFSLDKNAVHDLPYEMFRNINASQRALRERNYYTFLITRHPFERLVATYRNKFEEPYSTHFQKVYGQQILRTFRKNLTEDEYKSGVGVTFSEFVKFVIQRKAFDEHWSPMAMLCSPCYYKYDYLGKMETLLEDSAAILRNAGLNERFYFPQNTSDRYKSKSSAIMQKYFLNVSHLEIQQLHDIYKDDFLAFGYTLANF